ncbi:hypothetical protein [Chlamydia caviae]|uniref:Uncharacterized protein n=1 Tax=Chlamydia caviae (strain ATCC VR-813 / DSM 19441 / 03DC25 / GPIC) TaxID=227941 RepID=Q822M0_CHLCV|nr:hypothetical protein [Chlamydia caviae]AAP05404.1 conserved hypothetical protein [Chlamydia caviae GPIC]
MKKQEKIRLSSLFQRLFILVLFLSPFPAFTEAPLSLKQNIFRARTGDYAVFSKGVQKFFLFVKSVSSDTVWIEMTEFPHLSQQDRALVQNKPWKSLIHELHSPRRVFLISLSKKDIDIFCLNPKTHQLRRLQPEDLPIFSTLLQLSLNEAPNHLIKRQGKNQDPWSPRITIEGNCSLKTPAQAWHANWPKDSSVLSGKNVLMYFTACEISAFPLWTSIETPKGTVVLRTIDVGHDASSSYSYILPDINE